jgi:hypothetical protein
MKGRWLLGFTVSFAVLAASIILQSKACAEPHRIFNSVLPELERRTRVPILLPSELPRLLLERSNSFYLHLENADANSYSISILTDPNCRGANVCFLGSFSAERITPSAANAELQSQANVSLPAGIKGFFEPLSCGGSCAPPYLQWVYQGVLYSISLRTSDESPDAQRSILVAMASSSLPSTSQPTVARSPSSGQQTGTERSPSGQQTPSGRSSNSNSGQQTAAGRVSTPPSQSSPVAASSQELVVSNVGCTTNLQNILGQSALDYCRSAEADSGILFDVDEFRQTKNRDGSITVQIKLFNRGSADGLIEVYDARGNLVDGKIINGNKPPTGFLQSGYRMFVEYPKTWWSSYPPGDARRDLKEQSFSITIPAGGFVNITKSSNLALWYNAAMLAIEVSQLKDPEFTQQESVKEFIWGFAKDAVFSKQSKTVINIFKSEPSLQGVFTLEFLDERKVGEVLQRLWEYTTTLTFDESDGFWKEPKNPLYEAFKDVGLETGNVGVENAIDRFLLPGLGTFVRSVRQGGNALNTLARLLDYNNAMKSGEKATVMIRNISTNNRR